MMVCCLPSKSRKKTFAHAIMYTFSTHTGLVHDVTDLVKVPVLIAMFLRLSNINFNNLDHESTEKC